MQIKSLTLNNFRNYRDVKIDFNENINIIYGKNAQGKTNILEAIFCAATSKSHRTSNYKELIYFDSDEAHIGLEFEKNGIVEEIDIHLNRYGKKSIAINKVSIRKLNELFGLIKIVLFSPEDLSLIKSGPKERRRFMDLELCQINPLYFYNLKKYYSVLKQRNNLLKELKKNKQDMDLLEIWDIQLVEYGIKVMEYREEFIHEINEYYKKNHYIISGNTEKCNVFYEKNCEPKFFQNKLLKNNSYDIHMGNTSIGPHKDDLLFEINGVDIRKFGSQGQQRTAALSLKLSEIELIRNNYDENPILLLDDVLSELDETRQRYLIHSMKDVQTMITCTGIEDFIHTEIKVGNLIQVEKGKICINGENNI